MIFVRPILPHDQNRLTELFRANVDDLNMSPREAHWRTQQIANAASSKLTPEFGVKALVSGELSRDVDRIVGAAIVTPGRHYSVARTGSLRLLVDSEYRGKGFGSKLVLAVLDEARERGFVRIEAQPYSTSDYVTFWGRNHFAYEGRRRNAVRLVGTGRIVHTDVWAWTGELETVSIAPADERSRPL